MTKQEAISYIENYTWSQTKLGLERTHALLAALGDPQKKLKFIHVAGSNGKGSTCAMLSSILQQAGYRTGLYTSPYLLDFCERIQIDGEYIPGDDLAVITDKIKKIAEEMADHPSQFELVTAIAMEYYARKQCDIVVLEVGMGGAMDSTNAIDAPEVAVITNIGLEHTEYLGNTLEEIAHTKAGIIKKGCTAVCYDGSPKVLKVLRSVCQEKGVPLKVAEFSQITPISHDLEGQRFLWRDIPFTLPLLGDHQLHNAAVVLQTVRALLWRGWKITPEAIQLGLAQVKWPARFEVLRHEPLFILDGGHNPQCAQVMADMLAEHLPGQKVTFLMGVLADKDREAMLTPLMPFAKRVVTLTPQCPRALPAATLAEEVTQKYARPAVACDTALHAITECLKNDDPIIAFGSLYMAGEIRAAVPTAYDSKL